jgi:hypothetical protein
VLRLPRHHGIGGQPESGPLQSATYEHYTQKFVSAKNYGSHLFSLHLTQLFESGTPLAHPSLQLSKPHLARLPKATAQSGVKPYVLAIQSDTHTSSIAEMVVHPDFSPAHTFTSIAKSLVMESQAAKLAAPSHPSTTTGTNGSSVRLMIR